MNNMVSKTTITVGGEEKEIQIYKLPASEGIVMGTQLLKLALPVLGGLADEMFTEEDVETPKTFSEIAQRLLMQLDNFDVLKIVKRLLKEATVNGREVNFDEYFMGNYGELVMILEFALKENFKSFFEGTGLKNRFFQALGAAATDQDQAESDEQ